MHHAPKDPCPFCWHSLSRHGEKGCPACPAGRCAVTSATAELMALAQKRIDERNGWVR